MWLQANLLSISNHQDLPKNIFQHFKNLFFITANISLSTTLAIVFLLLEILSNTPLYHTDLHVLYGEQIWLEK